MLGAGGCREDVRACRHEHSSCRSSWRKLSIQVSIRLRPSLGRTATSKATTRQPGGVLTPELQLHMRTANELMATGRENDGSDMPRREVFLHLLPGFRGPTPYHLDLHISSKCWVSVHMTDRSLDLDGVRAEVPRGAAARRCRRMRRCCSRFKRLSC